MLINRRLGIFYRNASVKSANANAASLVMTHKSDNEVLKKHTLIYQLRHTLPHGIRCIWKGTLQNYVTPGVCL